jgi:hypothetical protein
MANTSKATRSFGPKGDLKTSETFKIKDFELKEKYFPELQKFRGCKVFNLGLLESNLHHAARSITFDPSINSTFYSDDKVVINQNFKRVLREDIMNAQKCLVNLSVVLKNALRQPDSAGYLCSVFGGDFDTETNHLITLASSGRLGPQMDHIEHFDRHMGVVIDSLQDVLDFGAIAAQMRNELRVIIVKDIKNIFSMCYFNPRKVAKVCQG